MSDDKQERRFDRLTREALIPAGFRPESDEDIERMLDGLGFDDSPERTERVLSKVLGDTPLAWERPQRPVTFTDGDSVVSVEFAEMFRSRGDELPPDVEEKLREMERRAMEEVEGETPEGGGDGDDAE